MPLGTILGFGPPLPPPPPPPVVPVHYIHVVEAGFGTQPPADPNNTVTLAGTLNLGGWTRLSGRDAGGVIRNGIIDVSATSTSRNPSTGQPEPGTANLTLDTNQGWLDPTNPFSPYHGYLTPGTPIRVRITDGTHFWPVWRGFVKRWPMSESVKDGQHAVIEAYDAIGWLGGVYPLVPTELHRLILGSGPSSYWPHDEPSGATSLADLPGSFDADLIGSAALGGPSMTPEGYGGSVTFVDQANCMARPLGGAMPPPPFTINFLIRVEQVGSIGAPTYYLQAGGAGLGSIVVSSEYVAVHDATTGAASVAYWDGGAGTALLGIGGPYMLTMTYDAAGTLACFADGGLRQRISGVYLDPGVITNLFWGATSAPSSNSTGTTAQISNMGFWNRVLSDAEILAMAYGAFYARSGEPVDYRFNYLLDLVRWPAYKRRTAPSVMTVGPARLAGKTILDLLKDALAFEDGTLAADGDANIMLIPRNGDPAPSFTVGGLTAPKQEATYSTNEAVVVTSASASDPAVSYDAGGGIVGGRSVSLSQLAHTADDAWLTAHRLVQLGAAQKPGIDSVTLNPIDTFACLTMEHADIGTVARRTRWSPTTDIVEPYQVTSVTDLGGAGQQLRRQFSLLQKRQTQWTARVPGTVGGATASGFSTPWQTRFDSTSLTVACQFRTDNWAQTAVYKTLVSHAGPGPFLGWTFVYDCTLVPPRLTLTWDDNSGTRTTIASNPLLRVGTRFLWAAVRFLPSTGQVSFYISNSNIYNLTSWGGATVGPTTLRATGNGPIEVGCINGISSQLAGDVLKAYVLTIANVPIALFDPTADNQTGVTPWTSSSGEIWTPEGVAGLIAT